MNIQRLLSLMVIFMVLGVSAQNLTMPSDLKTPSVPNERNPTVVERDVNLTWEGLKTYRTFDDRTFSQINFKNARHRNNDMVPYFGKTVEVGAETREVKVRLSNIQTSTLTDAEQSALDGISLEREFSTNAMVRQSAGRTFAHVSVEVLRRVNGRVEKLTAFDIDLIETKFQGRSGGRSNHSWKSSSILSAGDWVRLASAEDGIYKVTYADMQGYGLSVSGIASEAIRLYGTGAGALSYNNSDPRPDDLIQIPIDVVDGGDGVFNPGDYFLFYGEDQVTWDYINDSYLHAMNPYSDSVYYFLTTSEIGGQAKRIAYAPAQGSSNYTSNAHDHLDVYETDETNLIQSGRVWYGEQIGASGEKDIGFPIPNIELNQQVRLRASIAVRSVSKAGVTMSMLLSNQPETEKVAQVSPVGTYYGAPYAFDVQLSLSALPQSANVIAKLRLNNATNPLAIAWIDYVAIHARRKNEFMGSFVSFRDVQSSSAGRITQFNFNSNRVIRVWDVTNLGEITEMSLSGNVQSGFSFVRETSQIREFVAFSDEAYLTPRLSGTVGNQNLHALVGIEYIIVTHPLFKSQAERISNLHESIDGMTTLVVTPQQIYNEFSGGAQDITAIKEFMRMLYFKADSTGGTRPKYLLLYGDASYDYKDKVSGNSNFVPTHQMAQSLDPVASVASDDFFGLLDDDEGESRYDLVDIGVGRLPVRNRKEAEDVANKIIHYSDNAASFGDWRNKIAFVADDADRADGTGFMKDFETLGAILDTNAPQFVIHKLYMDAFKQQTGSGGQRYPEGAEAISERVNKGALMVYFIGHGGELGWAHERILDVPTINKWSNFDNLPLFITATCEFARFDDPRRTSGGEFVMLNPSGGGIGLLTTTRAVYSSPNLTLTTQFTDYAFASAVGTRPRLGDMMLETKVRTLDVNEFAALNSRSFTLIGDPALRIAYPEMRAILTNVPDTLRALDKVKITGQIVDQGGNKIETFNGVVYPAVYDKVSDLQSLNNDGQGAFGYEEWKNLVFKGKSSVKDGTFNFEFVVPKDIGRSFGIGRINLYADNGVIDANGDYRLHKVGGLSDNPVTDDEGPQVDLYMNNTKFVFGGLTNEDPDLYAEVSDESGINMVGSGIGHDITSVLDGNTTNTIVLNDYYEADMDSYQSGTIRYPFSELPEGKHSLKLQVWDVHNNPSDAYTEFIVANDEKLALEHVLNYPNPFTTNTDFFFEHNKPGQPLYVRIEVFTVAGKLIKTLDGEYASDGYRVGPINWNGRDEYGDVLAKGVYLYRVAVKTPIGEQVEKYERLVLLK